MPLGRVNPEIVRSLYPTLPEEIQQKLCNPRHQEVVCKVYNVGKRKLELLEVCIRAVDLIELAGKPPPYYDFLHLTGLDDAEVSIIKQRMLDFGWQPYLENWD